MARNPGLTTGCIVAALCICSTLSVTAAETYYTDQTWNYGHQATNQSYSNNYTATYNMGATAARQRAGSKSRQQTQPNTYTESGYSGTYQQPGASSWSPSPNTYTDQGQQTETEQQQQYADQYSQYSTSYQSQQQAPKKRGVLSRMFHRESSSPASSSARASSLRSYPGSGFIRGVASWYGRDFHGGKTANGERYDMNSMTAAHRTLPFGTLVKVTNESNGRECVVRINNRGPFLKGRVIDLSKAAASEIGMISRGVCRVSMQVLGQ